MGRLVASITMIAQGSAFASIKNNVVWARNIESKYRIVRKGGCSWENWLIFGRRVGSV
jgi:hypothetical protein